jgi:hypothetical protein
MKLAEALLLRADMQKKFASLKSRAQKHAVVQQGEKPAEDSAAILREAEQVAASLQQLVYAINRTNLHSAIKSGPSLTEALAMRDALVMRHGMLQGVIDACAKPPERYGMKEIRWVATVKVRDLQEKVDDLAQEIRELNASIQEAGWKVELEA